jgi:hypothetical protein
MNAKNKRKACGVGHFYHKKWYNGMYRLGVFREGITPNENFHAKRYSRLLIRMSGCNILFNRNLWFRVIEIKRK